MHLLWEYEQIDQGQLLKVRRTCVPYVHVIGPLQRLLVEVVIPTMHIFETSSDEETPVHYTLELLEIVKELNCRKFKCFSEIFFAKSTANRVVC